MNTRISEARGLLISLAALLLLSVGGCSKGSGRYPVADETGAQKQFLTENAMRNGVTTTTSGLQYEALKVGEGPTAKPSNSVTVHYVGTLIDGTEFDSSYSRNEPATFPLDRVIKGWTEGVQLMNVGSQYRFVIPAELAYGNSGAGNKIEPGATLIFSIELLAIN